MPAERGRTHPANVEVERVEAVVLRARDAEETGCAVLGGTSSRLVLGVRV